MTGSAAIWHEVECGGYEADLPLWEELAAESAGDVLELGCGTGRVALHLARSGAAGVTGLDSEAALLSALSARGQPAVETALGDARDFDLGRRFGLIVAPMQLIQLLAGRRERVECLGRVAAHLQAGGRAAFAIVEELEASPGRRGAPPLPDVREADGWIYSSQPLDVVSRDGAFVVRRLRQLVSPAGELGDSVDEVALWRLSAEELEQEAAAAGLEPAGRRPVPPTDAHVGSTVVVLERSG